MKRDFERTRDLIEAAPDLLKAARRLSDALGALRVLDTEGEAGADATDALHSLRAAIARADRRQA